jgi:hypothetical protein
MCVTSSTLTTSPGSRSAGSSKFSQQDAAPRLIVRDQGAASSLSLFRPFPCRGTVRGQLAESVGLEVGDEVPKLDTPPRLPNRNRVSRLALVVRDRERFAVRVLHVLNRRGGLVVPSRPVDHPDTPLGESVDQVGDLQVGFPLVTQALGIVGEPLRVLRRGLPQRLHELGVILDYLDKQLSSSGTCSFRLMSVLVNRQGKWQLFESDNWPSAFP